MQQNFPSFVAPQEQVHSFAGAGFPQLLQNLPLLIAPHAHNHPSGAFCSGLGLPQLLQNLPVFVVPQEQFQESNVGVGFATGVVPCVAIPG